MKKKSTLEKMKQNSSKWQFFSLLELVSFTYGKRNVCQVTLNKTTSYIKKKTTKMTSLYFCIKMEILSF